MAINEVKFCYNSAVITAAFNGTSSKMIISKDGDIFKDTMSLENLVLTCGGVVGPAGLTNITVKINDMNTGAITNPLEYTRRLAKYYVDQMDLQKASGDALTYLGEAAYKIPRFDNESDSEYANRIVTQIMQIKCTPVVIREALLPYADDVEISEDVDLGAFANMSFAGFYDDVAVIPSYGESLTAVRDALAGLFGGLIYHFRVILTNPDPIYADRIVAIIKDFKAAGITFDILEV